MASSSSPSSSPSSSAQSGGGHGSWIYLSYSDNDVPIELIDKIHRALDLEAIHTVRRLEQINHFLMNDIKETWIVIIVFSWDYPYSSRCMNELGRILEYKRGGKLVVKLVFFDVGQEEVTTLTEGFEIELCSQACIGKNLENMREVVSLSGLYWVNPGYVGSPFISGWMCDLSA